MKTKIYDVTGKEKGSIDLPKEFSALVREDIVAKVLEAKKRQQPYAPSPVAGNQYSASGVVIHQRHVWKSGYGRGISRVPRKIFSRKGSQFNWEGATSPNTKGGRRAHPPKIAQFLNTLRINKKEMKIAFVSALSATANKDWVVKKYETVEKVQNAPFVVESKFLGLKTKQVLESLNKILGDELYNVAIKKKSVRAGKGKLRGRKYKSNAGMLLVVGNDEKIKAKSFEVVQVNSLGVTDLARGGLGRLVVYTEKAVKDLSDRLSGKLNKENKKEKKE